MKKFIRHISTAWLLLLVTTAGSHAQEAFPGFTRSQIKELHTAKNDASHSKEEQKVILVMNLVRHNGTVFWDSIAAPFIRENEIENSRYVKSLERDMKEVRNLPPLKPDQILRRAAQKHAVSSGRAGTLGHDSPAGSFESRLKHVLKTHHFVLENCDYGSNDALDIVMNLLIDEGIPGVGHRKNIFHPDIDAVGVSIAPHKSYDHNCVQVFGQLKSP